MQANSETTAVAVGQVDQLRIYLMAMLPLCKYTVAGYFNRWLSISTKSDAEKLPRIHKHYEAFGERLPKTLAPLLNELESALA